MQQQQRPADQTPAQAEQQKRQQEQQEEARQSMLTRFLAPEARARLARIAVVKPEKARAVEDFLLASIKAGRIRGGTGAGGLVGEQDLIGLLEQAEAQEAKQHVVFQRKEAIDSDEDDLVVRSGAASFWKSRNDDDSDFD